MRKTFLFDLRSFVNPPVLVVGIVEVDKKKEEDKYEKILDELRQKITINLEKSNFNPVHLESLREIDMKLANALCKGIAEEILALGATIEIEGQPGPTGGVIGNPQRSPSSQKSIFEEIGPQLYLHTFTGGPGIIFECSQNQLQQIEEKFLSVAQGWPDFSRLILGGRNCGIDRMIGVMDGTGTPLPGAVFIYEEDCLTIKHLS